LATDHLRDNLGIRLALEGDTLALQLMPKRAKIFDDAVVYDSDAIGRVRMCIGFARPAVRRPPGMANADHARQRPIREALLQIPQFAFGAQSNEPAILKRRDSGRVVAAIF